jgi:general L-amino acid transport system permease protein
VSLTKNSSLAVAIGFPDVVSILNTTSNQTGHALETMVIMIAIYLALSLGVAAGMNAYNRRLLRVGA